MPESTLSCTIDDLKADIGHFLGYGRGPTVGEPAWTVGQENNIQSVLKSGLQQFYNPPPLGAGAPWAWSFLRPFADLPILQGDPQVPLPDDFGAFEGPIYITTPATVFRRFGLQLTNPGLVQARHAAMPDTTGAPQMAALEPIKGTTATAGTRYVLWLWPTPDAPYNLRAEYRILPEMLTGALPYPPGGSEHAATIKAACLAAAELELDDTAGVRQQQWMVRLAASVAIDAKKKGTNLGYNGDPRLHGRLAGRWRDYDNPAVTYNGNPL